MLIPFITEPIYRNSSFWCAQTHTGIEAEIARKKYTGLNIGAGEYQSYDYDGLFERERSPRMVVLIGTSPLWIPKALEFFSARMIDVLLVSYQPPENVRVRGVVRIDYVAGVDTLLRHLTECGCRNPVLYAGSSDSSSDSIKKRAFFELTGQSRAFDSVGCIDNRSGLKDCYDMFRKHIRTKEVDSVLCVNDIAAASLINRLRAEHISVPDEIQVVCFGNSEISRLYRPSVTSLLLDNIEVGRQAVSVFSYLAKSNSSVSASVRICGSLAKQESTRIREQRLPMPAASVLSAEPVAPTHASFYEDEEVKAFTVLEDLLRSCDTFDFQILCFMLEGRSTEWIAESLCMASETVRYRVRRILQNAGLRSRGELIDFIRGNDFGSVLSEMNAK